MPRQTRLTWVLGSLVVLIPFGLAIGWHYVPVTGRFTSLHASPVSHFPPSSLEFKPMTLGSEPGYRPRITNVRVVDLDQDGRLDLLVCDASRQRVFWYRRSADGGWDEVPIGGEVNGPAGAVAADLDGDGDLDVVVAVLGSLLPTDAAVGQVVWLENRNGTFHNRVLLDDVRRVSDVQVGDLDGDKDLDIAVAVFGFHHGELLWLENRGESQFRDHLLMATQGPSHVPVADFDGDGDLDIAVLVSQDHEEVWLFENRGQGTFHPQLVHGFLNFDLGLAGVIPVDLDRDGDMDLLLSAGDNLEVNHHYPLPWHGCLWLENRGGRQFELHRITAVGGVYAAAAADFDGDGDLDVAAACMFNDWHAPGAASLVLLENDGRQQFTATKIAAHPISLATVAAGDLNGDGLPDLVAGSLHLIDAPERPGRVTLWLNRLGARR